jgi:hypothetical protein
MMMMIYLNVSSEKSMVKVILSKNVFVVHSVRLCAANHLDTVYLTSPLGIPARFGSTVNGHTAKSAIIALTQRFVISNTMSSSGSLGLRLGLRLEVIYLCSFLASTSCHSPNPNPNPSTPSLTLTLTSSNKLSPTGSSEDLLFDGSFDILIKSLIPLQDVLNDENIPLTLHCCKCS